MLFHQAADVHENPVDRGWRPVFSVPVHETPADCGWRSSNAGSHPRSYAISWTAAGIAGFPAFVAPGFAPSGPKKGFQRQTHPPCVGIAADGPAPTRVSGGGHASQRQLPPTFPTDISPVMVERFRFLLGKHVKGHISHQTCKENGKFLLYWTSQDLLNIFRSTCRYKLLNVHIAVH